MDLRRFAPAHGQEEEDFDDIKELLKYILQWMAKGGVTDIPPIDVVYEQAIIIADIIKYDINGFYNGCARPKQACQRQHCKAEDDTYASRYGTIIQKDTWTLPRLSSKCPTFLWVYNHCMLKTANTVVVEGMCKFISKQADSVRGLTFKTYANDVMLELPATPTFPFPLLFSEFSFYRSQVCKRGQNCMEWTATTRSG